MDKVIAIIPAGGKGIRSGLKIPKQFLKINGKELISYTIEVFQKCKEINEIYIAAPVEYFPLLEKCKAKYRFTKLKGLIPGGKERQDSVYNVLNKINFNDDDIIAVHDAARPLLSKNLLTDVIADAKRFGNAVLAVNARDTLASGKRYIESYSDRKNIYYIQTPQVFRYSELKAAFDKAYEDNFTGTDESMLVKRLGRNVFITQGSHLNFKITTPEDIKLFKKIVPAKK
jgi:2-C-methyl-D-erythritol 4-phosphate cytidylyltransferase